MEADPAYTPSYFLMIGLFSLQAWAWAVAAFSIGMRVLRFRSRSRGGCRLGDAFLPPPPAGDPRAGNLVVGWDAGIPVKLPVLLVLSFAASAGVAWLLSRAAVTRRLLGVKARPSPPVRRR